MANVTLYIDTIDGQPWTNDGNNPIRLSGTGPWLVVGRAIAETGYSIASLIWEKDLMSPPIDISRANLPNYEFELPSSFIIYPDTMQTFWVTAHDNDTPPGFATEFGYVILPALIVVPPVRPVAAKT